MCEREGAAGPSCRPRNARTHARNTTHRHSGTRSGSLQQQAGRQAGDWASFTLLCSALSLVLLPFVHRLSVPRLVRRGLPQAGWLAPGCSNASSVLLFSLSFSLFLSSSLSRARGKGKKKHVGWLARLQSIPPLVLLSSPRIFPLSRSSVPFLFLFLLLLRALPVLISLLSLSSRARGCAWVCASFLSRAWLYACIHSFNFNSKLRNAGTGSRPSLRGVCVCAVGELLRLLFGGLTAASGNVEGGRPACYSAPRQPPPLTGARPPHSDVQQLILLPCAARRNIGSSTTATTEDEILIAPCCPSTIFSASPSSESNISAAPRGKA